MKLTLNGLTNSLAGQVGEIIDYLKLANKPSINNIELTGNKTTSDLGLIDNTVNDLLNYYLKSETYSKTEVNTIVSNINQFRVLRLDVRPEVGEEKIIYLIPKAGGFSPDVHDEWLWINSTWELIGNTQIDLSEYAKTSDVNTGLALKQDKTGDSKDNTVSFIQSTVRDNILTTDTHSTLFSKIKKWFADLSTVAFTGSYTDLDNKPTIPTTTSALTNNSGFITKSVSDLDNYTTSSSLTSALNLKQNITDNTFETTAKTVVGAVNELNTNKKEYPKLVCDYTVSGNTIIQPISLDYGTGVYTTSDVLPVYNWLYLGYFINNITNYISCNVIPTELQALSGLITYHRIDDYHFKLGSNNTQINSYTSTINTDVTKFHFELLNGIDITGLSLNNNFRIILKTNHFSTPQIRLNNISGIFIGSSYPQYESDIAIGNYNAATFGQICQADIFISKLEDLLVYTKNTTFFYLNTNKIAYLANGLHSGFSVKNISEIGNITSILFNRYYGGFGNGSNIKIYDYGENLC